MNKTALKKFATEARRELLQKVELQARKLGITAEAIQKVSIESSDAVFIDGKQLSDTERSQRNKLIARINEIGFDRVMEETAYTWFNRFIALRYMEVNDYLPTKVRVLSSNSDSMEPDMMKEALSLDLELDKEHVYDLKMNNKTDELFKYLIKMHCNDLNRYMPFMFETIEDYSEILFPEGLLGTDSFVRQMTDTEVIPEDNWEKIEVIGWLYQYYIADEKDRVFKAKKKYKAEEIPFATQLFTPDWIVQYMVQNSLGRYWTEAHPEHNELIEGWEFFLQHQEEDFQEKIAPYVNKDLNVEDIKCFDPAMGSGHILVYMFDVLHEIYSKSGYMEREIPRLIIENNLYGLDIDDRAYQLASFAIVMKALQYNRRFLRSIERDGLVMNLAAIQETNSFNEEEIAYLADEASGDVFERVQGFLAQFEHAKSIGSLLKITFVDTNFLQERLQTIQENPVMDLFESEIREKVLSYLPKLIKQTGIMGGRYDVLVTNPPYMGSGSMNKELTAYLGEHYKDSKRDLFAAFMEVDHYLKDNAFYACINQHSWMFLSSYKELRIKLLANKNVDSMFHLGPRAFEEIGGEVVQSTAFVLKNSKKENYIGDYIRLTEFKDSNEKEYMAKEVVKNPNSKYRYKTSGNMYKDIPGNQISYWISDNIVKLFRECENFKHYGNARVGLDTGDNKKYIRYWFEVNKKGIVFNAFDKEYVFESGYKWVPHTKGGSYRKWYGNLENIIAFDQESYNSLLESGNRLPSKDYYFLEGLNWSRISSTKFAVRYTPVGSIFNSVSPTAFIESEDLMFFMSLLNTQLISQLLQLINPTLHYEAGNINVLPIKYEMDQLLKRKIGDLGNSCIEISKSEWDSFETSWSFKRHPMINYDTAEMSLSFKSWKEFAESQFNQLQSNEEELNRMFIDIYGLQDELTPDVAKEDITIRKADLERDIKSFISYALGCSFGRYSLDEEGLIYAGGEFDPTRYETFQVDEDNILPILSGAYFEDDIVSRFVEFIRVTYGEESLTENLDFIADALTRRKNETARETLRRYFMNDFYKDHVQIYKKHPIYWQFTSGKEKAFNCLIYMHRYDKSTLSRIRTDYLHEVQIRMDAEKEDLLSVIDGDSTTKEINSAKKELKSLNKKIDELKAYDELLHHMADMQIEIDLDDGVKVNYAKFEGLVAKI